MTRYNIPKTFQMYNNGHNAQSTMIRIAASIAGVFLPIKIGNVLAPSALSPSTSSMSLTISRAVVITNAKNPKNMDVVMIVGLFIVNPPNTNPNPVMKPTVRFPIRGVLFNLYAYK